MEEVAREIYGNKAIEEELQYIPGFAEVIGELRTLEATPE